MADAGAAVVIADDELLPMRLRETVLELLDDPERLADMREASDTLARPAAARAVAAQVLAAADGAPHGAPRAAAG
jgi:UDP-N-acetylglucosamine--N-acetylmuramyl-(pentapeptide) pyrophosphoryl-undecaprenol N-acetylglucosamine transferase